MEVLRTLVFRHTLPGPAVVEALGAAELHAVPSTIIVKRSLAQGA
jgi:hypothetical protein